MRDWTAENAKTIADALTVLRVFLSFIIILCAIIAAKSLLPLVVVLTLIGWTTDVLDGKMARRDPSGRKTWIGDMDFGADMILIYSGLLYFIAAGYLPFWPFFLYGIYAATTAIIWTRKSVMMAVAAPVAAVPIIFSFVHYPIWGWIFIGWIAVDLLFNWSDFTTEIGEFIENVDEKENQGARP
ncbi:MAG: CDP-alcohol phosphatidyltransferase family protein [Actinomycetota bacterium]|nr:CDP-alcohol phosphatidyltransferase family protein [Actinomycetota bacterium]